MKPIRFALAALLCAAARPALAQEKLMFSPNGDGVKDDVTFRLKLADNTGISSWFFEIQDAQKRLVQKFSGKGTPPASLKWDGKDLHNNLVKDGTYFYSLGLVTPAGNKTAIAPSPIIVDRVPPEAESSVSPALFSPASTTGVNEATFKLKAADEDGIYSWLLTIKDKEGAQAKSIGGKGSPPEAVRWDGRGDFEEDVPDGAYAFELIVEDNAGNRTTTPPKTVSIRRQGVASTVEVSPVIFSPNGDGYKDEVTLTMHSADPDVVARWSLRILNTGGRTIHEFTGVKEPPRKIVWDGKLDAKSRVPDGSYTVVMYETDSAGNTSSSNPQPLEVDTTPPAVQARLEPDLLSPNGDGVADAGTFYVKAQDASPLQAWSLRITNDVGRPVKTFSGQPGSKPNDRIEWKGDGDDGNTLQDGVYLYSIEATDIAGNKAATEKRKLRVDVTPPLVSVAADPLLFSPNAEGAGKETILTPSVQDASPIASWSLDILDAKGKIVRNYTSPADKIPPQIVWDGKSNDRVPLPDGDYTLMIAAKDVAGNKASGQPVKVTIGATRPVPEVSVDNRAISPNADGFKDLATFTLKARAFNPIKEWIFKITDRGEDKRKGVQTLRSFQGRGGVPGQLQWGGENDGKRVLSDGDYLYSLEVVDIAGNRSATAPAPIRVDTTPPTLAASASLELFSPNGDGFKDDTAFLPSYKDASPAGAWDLSIRDTSKRVVKAFSGNGAIPLSLPWKGVDESGKTVPDGSYTYILTAADDVGNKTSTQERILRVDNTPPTVALQANPTLFSPIGNSSVNETTLLLDAKDASNLEKWRLTLVGNDIAFKTFSGLGQPPKSFPWDGKSDRNQIVPDGTYTGVLYATDEVGNTGKSAPVQIRVDTSKPLVTVTAETTPLEELTPQMTVSQLKNRDLVISLASEVLFDTGQATIKAQAYPTLMRAVALVRRYPKRKVRVEGHADNVPIHNEQFKNNVELSDGRAKAVMEFFREKGGVEPARMSAQGFGDSRPRASNESEEGRRQNRRVEIILQREEN